ncbi:MAG: OmcA/MtrC family decaheme c-type cytochrome [Planctomycetota bacterium]|jgi:OmcA/MtrC family decaheme c-type cytochrome
MTCKTLHNSLILLLGLALLALPLGCGDDGDDIFITGAGDPDTGPINAMDLSDEELGNLDVETGIENIFIASPPIITFTYETADGRPILGLEQFWADDPRFVRFTITKLVPGQNGDPDSWVAYTRDAVSGDPDYDTGDTLRHLGGGRYEFKFLTDVDNVPGVPFEPGLTHRVAGQIGSRSVPLEAQNMWLDVVPAGGAVSETRNIAVMDTCNECHDNLVFHGRRFEVEYCVQCHNPDLAMGEGDMSFMIHRIHGAGDFTELGTRGGTRPPSSFAELTYPQDLANCRKCHKDSPETPEGDNWFNLPNQQACTGCHSEVDFGTGVGHGPGIPQPDNQNCLLCHGPGEGLAVATVHTTANSTPNNPQLFDGQRDISYELIDAVVDVIGNQLTVQFKIYDGTTPLDMTNLPDDLVDGVGDPFRLPSFLLAYALPQDGIDEPADWNNRGRRGAQPISLGLGSFSPYDMIFPIGVLSFDGVTGINTALVTDVDSNFPLLSTMRAVGIQSYLQQDLDGDESVDVSLHAISDVVAVTGDAVRREVIATENCSSCHEWFEGHGGNRVLGFGSPNICVMCHNPNQSSSGRTVTDPTGRGLDQDLADAVADGSLDPSVDPNDPLTYPEDAQNFKDLIHGIHSEGFRDRPFQHVRGGRQGYYDWSHITFPRGASTSNCMLCHKEGSFDLPLDENLLVTTVRTSGEFDGRDTTVGEAEIAFSNVPNFEDWINSPTASACVYCHTGGDAVAHMSQNGGFLSVPPFAMPGGWWTNRTAIGSNFESCSLCHGPGKTADLAEVHKR